jgi:hypothetical protein
MIIKLFLLFDSMGMPLSSYAFMSTTQFILSLQVWIQVEIRDVKENIY